MRIVILADFPLHVIPDFGEKFRPDSHFATWLPQVAEAFADFPDLDVHWLVLSKQLSAPHEVLWKRQTFHAIPTAPRGRAWTFFARDRTILRDYITRLQPDLVHGWGTEDVYAFAATTSGRPNIVSMQGILSYYVLKNRMHPRVYIQALAELFILHRADCITVESAWGREIILQRNPRAKVHLVEYGVQPHFLDIPWQPDPVKPTAIFIGTLTPRKGIQDAVAAFRDPALSHAELLVLGSGGGPWYDQLRASASPNVKWLGRLAAAETAELLSHAWCMILPTRADTSPNVVKEARVIGLPVISTPYGGQTTYIQHGKNGFLVEPGDVDSLTRHAVELLGNLDKTRAYGAYRHEEHRAALHSLETARRFRSLYLSMAGEPRA